MELGEVDWAWSPGGVSKRTRSGVLRGPKVAEGIGEGRIAAIVATVLEFAEQAPAGQARECGDPFAQVGDERVDRRWRSFRGP